HRDVVDQLLNDDGFADTRPAKCADFAALCKWANKVDDLDARFQNLCACILLSQCRREAMNRVALFKFDRAATINRMAGHVEESAKNALAYWHTDGAARINHFHAAFQTVG